MSVQAHPQLPVPLQVQTETLRDYLNMARRRGWVIVLTLATTLVVVLATSSGKPTVYRASTTVMPDKSPPVILSETRSSIFADQASAQAPNGPALVELATSGRVLEGALARLSSSIGDEKAKTALAGLGVENVRFTDLVRITLAHSDPKVAAAAANAVAQSMLDANLAARRMQVIETRQFIDDQLAQAEMRLREAEQALVAFRKQQGNITLPEDTATSKKIAELTAQRVDVLMERRATQARLEAARASLASQTRVTPTQWTPSPVIVSLRNQLATLEVELAGLRRQFTPKHPAVISTQAKVEETQRRLAAELTRKPQPGAFGIDPTYQQLTQQIRQDELALATLHARYRALNAAVDEYTLKAESLPERETELVRLTRATRSAEQVYVLLLQRLQEAKIAETSIGSGIQILGTAAVPSEPVGPRRSRVLIQGMVLGLVMGTAAVAVIELLDDAVKSAAEVEQILGVSVLGSIPRIRRRRSRVGQTNDSAPLTVMEQADRPPKLTEFPPRAAPIAIQSYDQSLASEAFRILRAQLLFAIPEGRRNYVVLVTSALSGEGKSTIAANLAAALARTERKVWLIESDLRRPTLHQLYPEAASPGGLAAFLSGKVNVDEIARPTAEPNLWFVAGGTAHNAAELLASQQMARMIGEARVGADIALLDSPPVLPLSDASAIGSHADGALLVVTLERTGRRALLHTRRRLAQAGVPLIGAVVNFVPRNSPDSYYGAYQAYTKADPRARVSDASAKPNP